MRPVGVILALAAAGALCCSGSQAPAAKPSATPAPSAPEASSGNEPEPDREEEGERVRIEGALTAEGVECQALRTADDELYTLTGDLEGFAPGDRVRVEGRISRFSICMQGTTLTVERIERVD